MSKDERESELQTLGESLRDTRKKNGLSLNDAWEATRISKPVLKAMETDDYDSMPAVAFCRGFYVIYADFLKIDSKIILARYLKNRGLPPTQSKDQREPPISKSGKFSSYAEPSSISPRTSTTMFALTCFTVIVGICWYLNWNPITYISTKLLATQNLSLPPTPEVVTEKAVEIPATTVKDPVPEEETATISPYHLEITFHNAGTLSVTQDNGFHIDKQYENGQTLEWDAEESILLDMPEEIEASILLNGTELLLPASVDGRRLLSLPDDILN
jgi:cytoskeletal protein RodZ